MELSWLRKRLPGATVRSAQALTDKIDEMSKLIDSTVRRVRRLSADLRPCALDRLGLLAAIEWQSEQFERQSGIRCRFTSRLKSLDLDRPRSTELFRIFQEALTNVARHAGATRVTVSMKQVDRVLVLEVRDNGRGIAERELSDPGSLGLLGMRERVLL